MPYKLSREHGFTLTELMVSSTVMLLVTGAALTTFRNGLMINDSASQLSDSNQNLRAGTNQLVRDLMMAGRVIGPGGIPVPTGSGVAAFNRPGPPNTNLTFTLVSDTDTSLNLPDISTGFQLGPTINGSNTDMVTIMTVDEFMPVLTSRTSGALTTTQGTIDPSGGYLTVSNACLWLTGDTVNDTAPIQVGDLVYFKNANGSAIQTVTRTDMTHIYFDANSTKDWFHFNQRDPNYSGTVLNLKVPADTTSPFNATTSMFRALMITYYVDNTTTPGVPRLTRLLNHFTPQALAGVVEDLDLTYDLVDQVYNPSNVTQLPWTDVAHNVTYTSNQIRKVNVHVGVRSEMLSKPAQDYVRNHVSTAVDVRSLASVTKYATTTTQ